MAKTCSRSTKLHLAMFPWVSFGHFIPYLNLSNELARRGHSVSFLIPKGAQSKLEPLNNHPNLIHFFPIDIPQVFGLHDGAETASDVPLPLHDLLCIATDHTRDQVEQILATIRPDIVFFDMALWIPALGAKLKFKSVFFSAQTATSVAVWAVPSKRVTRDMTSLEAAEPPPGYPSGTLRFRANEGGIVKCLADKFGSGLSVYDRITTGLRDCDVITIRTCQEIEGPLCEYVGQQYKKPLFLAGPIFPGPHNTDGLGEKWTSWLGQFEEGSVVYCAFGSQIRLPKAQFQELLLGFELTGHPFLVALSPPEGCRTVEEAFPNGFGDRVRGRGWVYGDWVPQTGLLAHPSVGCFVSHCGSGSMWESLVTDCQIVLVPFFVDQIINTRLLVEELKVGVEVERSGESRWVAKESLRKAIESVMDKTRESAQTLKSNHANMRNILSHKNFQEKYMSDFIQNLQDLKD